MLSEPWPARAIHPLGPGCDNGLVEISARIGTRAVKGVWEMPDLASLGAAHAAPADDTQSGSEGAADSASDVNNPNVATSPLKWSHPPPHFASVPFGSPMVADSDAPARPSAPAPAFDAKPLPGLQRSPPSLGRGRGRGRGRGEKGQNWSPYPSHTRASDKSPSSFAGSPGLAISLGAEDAAADILEGLFAGAGGGAEGEALATVELSDESGSPGADPASGRSAGKRLPAPAAARTGWGNGVAPPAVHKRGRFLSVGDGDTDSNAAQPKRARLETALPPLLSPRPTLAPCARDRWAARVPLPTGGEHHVGDFPSRDEAAAAADAFILEHRVQGPGGQLCSLAHPERHVAGLLGLSDAGLDVGPDNEAALRAALARGAGDAAQAETAATQAATQTHAESGVPGGRRRGVGRGGQRGGRGQELLGPEPGTPCGMSRRARAFKKAAGGGGLGGVRRTSGGAGGEAASPRAPGPREASACATDGAAEVADVLRGFAQPDDVAFAAQGELRPVSAEVEDDADSGGQVGAAATDSGAARDALCPAGPVVDVGGDDKRGTEHVGWGKRGGCGVAGSGHARGVPSRRRPVRARAGVGSGRK